MMHMPNMVYDCTPLLEGLYYVCIWRQRSGTVDRWLQMQKSCNMLLCIVNDTLA